MTEPLPKEGATLPFAKEALPAARLRVEVEREGGASASRSIVLDGDYLRIGSHPQNDLVLVDPRVSRFHCALSRGRAAWRVTDTGSTNGTRLGDIAIRDADLPSPSSTLSLGDSLVRVFEERSTSEVELVTRPSFGDLFGTSLPMRRLFALLDRVSKSDVNVLIEGESGTGKELVATEIVRRGPRSRKPLVIVDCSNIAPSLVESELFGHVRGAFTGAETERVGAFEAADGGTVFLDEIGELPPLMQPKLLAVLERKTIKRLGETRERRVDVRVVAATNRSLEREVNRGAFREDLYFRLSVLNVRVPPLRERKDDLPILVDAILDRLGLQASRRLFGPQVLATMATHEWPGNVRELRNFIERAVVLEGLAAPSQGPGPGPEAAGSSPEAPGAPLSFRAAKELAVAEFERRFLAELLDRSGGNISRAAREAQMDRMNLHRLVQRHGLRTPQSLREGDS